MEPTTGIEPVNLILTKDVLYLLSYVGLFSVSSNTLKMLILMESGKYTSVFTVPVGFLRTSCFGAGNGIRTRDPQLGRLTL